MSPEEVRATLREAGLDLRPDEIALEAREDRWLARLPGDRMAWFPANGEGERRLAADRRLLRLLAERCRFRVPRVLYESGTGFDLRAAVPGLCDPVALYARIAAVRAVARRLGHALGLVLAEQHGRIDRRRVQLYNAASAICYLAYRRGIAAHVRHCGRTLAEDLAWVRKAIDAVL